VLPQIRGVGAGGWARVLLMSTLATGGQMLFLQAMRRAPLPLLTPFSYGQLAFATLFGWVLFDHVPDLWTGIGMGVIAAGGIGTVWLQAREAH
jgi:drug/metabolite transporter (DMT)-like permease